MVKITRAHNTRAYPEEGIKSTLFVEIEIEGFKKCIGGLPVEWVKRDVLAYVDSEYDRMLREAQADAVAETATKPTPREELVDKVEKVEEEKL